MGLGRVYTIVNQKGGVAENNAQAEASGAYCDIIEEYETAVYEYELINAYRNAAETRIDMWRTITSANKRGNI